MNILHNPRWIEAFNFDYKTFDEIPSEVFAKINQDLDKVQSKNPLVSILISAWNEEINILRCVASLSKMQTDIPFEIIVINNNSTDRTQDTLDHLHIKSLFEKTQGCGPARQFGQENANGKYILLADADCLYPPYWVEDMIKVLQKPGVVCVYGRYSFISEPGFPRWKLAMLETLKDIITEVRHINRPYYNAYGISMGFIKEYSLKVGFIKTRFWGDDGKMCLDLMQFGKVKQVRSNRARPWTGPRTLERSGTFSQALAARIKKEVKRFGKHFSKQIPDDQNDPKFSKK